MASVFRTDQALWYNNGVWGELGYAVPNFGDDQSTLNTAIHYLVDVTGRNLQAVMLHTDADLRTPPSINTLTRIHKLITRARTILAGRAVAPATPDMEAIHASPAETEFIVYPVPYFKVRNQWMKEWAGLIMNALSEACQHTENRKPYEISTTFSGLIGQYLHRVYRLMSTELFGVSATDAAQLNFTLTDAQLAAYDPSKYFTSTELIDTVPAMATIPTEDDLKVLTAGIPASKLVNLQKYSSGVPFSTGTGSADAASVSTGAGGNETAATSTTAAAASTSSFAAAPSP
jgi:hypothetical protein